MNVSQPHPHPDSEAVVHGDDPFPIFGAWLAEASRTEPNDPTAMTLATVDADGLPDARMVLLKAFDPDGFVFYTNLGSAKGRQLAGNPAAALCFHWKSLRRQVRIRGIARPVSDAEADAYFASRPRESRLGAWASRQSAPLSSRGELIGAVAKQAARFGLGTVPRPDFWSGFCVVPRRIEFWRDRPFRLHERTVFQRVDEAGAWSTQILFP